MIARSMILFFFSFCREGTEKQGMQLKDWGWKGGKNEANRAFEKENPRGKLI